jgi:hypothetical protein
VAIPNEFHPAEVALFGSVTCLDVKGDAEGVVDLAAVAKRDFDLKLRGAGGEGCGFHGVVLA